MRKLCAEFLGTFILVFTIGCNVITKQAVWGGVSIACSLTVMIYGLAKISGAHFNPAVSFTQGLLRKLPWPEVAKYVVAQVAAGICAGVAYRMLFDQTVTPMPAPGQSIWQAAVAELLYTFMLCFVILNTCSEEHKDNQFAGISIGFVIVAGAYGAGAISGGCFNPAVACGLDIFNWYAIPYVIFELIGALLAVLLFMIVRSANSDSVSLVSKLCSEFIGTYMLVLTVGLNVLGASTAGALSIASALMSMIFALGSVSGAHFNPAVTLAIFGTGRAKLTVNEVAGFIGCQVLGGLSAAITYCWLKNGNTFALKPAQSTWAEVCIAEFIYTAVLSFTVLQVATIKDHVLTEYFGFAIGMCVVVGAGAIGKISGASLNPAVSVGVGTAHTLNGGPILDFLVYSAIECAAGACAAGISRQFYASEAKQV